MINLLNYTLSNTLWILLDMKENELEPCCAQESKMSQYSWRLVTVWPNEAPDS